MSDADRIVAAIARQTAAQIRIAGMQEENRERTFAGQAAAYGDKQFESLIDELGLRSALAPDHIREGLDCIMEPQFAQLLLDDIQYAIRGLVDTVVTESVASAWAAKLAEAMAENIRALFDGDEDETETPKGGSEP